MMSYIKKFNEDFESAQRVTDYPAGMYKADSDKNVSYDIEDILEDFTDRLVSGQALEIPKSKVESFLDIISKLPWIKIPELGNSNMYYFILLGEDLYWSEKPYIGKFKIPVYTPNF
jgi:hypothetical protein